MFASLMKSSSCAPMSQIPHWLTVLLLTYAVCSFSEWFIHSQIMHGDPAVLGKVPIIGKAMARTSHDHLSHHKEVEMDMRLNHDRLDDSLFFGWHVWTVLFILTLLFGSCLHKRLRFGAKDVLIWSLSVATIYSFLWNNMHLDMHQVDHCIPLSRGVPNRPGMFRKGAVYAWLWKYHAVHHLQKGSKGNFNIILPGCDNIFGTYQGQCFDNQEYCKNANDIRCTVRTKGCMQDSDVL